MRNRIERILNYIYKSEEVQNQAKLKQTEITPTTTDNIINDLNEGIKKLNNELLNKHSKKIIDYFLQNINNYNKLSNITSTNFQRKISNFCNDKELTKPLQKLYKLMFKHKEAINFDKNTAFGEWYREIVTKCQLIDYTDISGCYVLRPLSYFIWNQIKNYMDKEITSLGIDECYFPLFASKAALEKESTFFDGFTAEVAWISHSGKDQKITDNDKHNLSTKIVFVIIITIIFILITHYTLYNYIITCIIGGIGLLFYMYYMNNIIHDKHQTFNNVENCNQKMAVRPTSESIIYPMFAKWIKSHKDLPLKINQWCNIVRWEFDNPTPFLRSREFLWQEGHTAYAHKNDAEIEVDEILELYANTYKDICAVPTIKGIKTKHETFPGAEYTKTVECYIPGSGRAIQGATSHHFGQKFSNKNAFDINYIDKDQKWKYVYQNSWGLTTRSIGVMILNHSDNKGLVLTPKVAKIQIMIVPINNDNTLINKSIEIKDRLKSIDLRVSVDDRNHKSLGYKRNEWELKGVPIRIEIGYDEIKNDQCTVSRRDLIEEKKKIKINLDENFEDEIKKLMENMHNNLYLKAKEKLNRARKTVYCWNEFLKEIQNGHIVDAPHCKSNECEKLIMYESREYFINQTDIYGVGQTGKAKALCIPEIQNELKSNMICVRCKNTAKIWILFGRSY